MKEFWENIPEDNGEEPITPAIGFFDVVSDISEKKQYILDEDNIKYFVPYQVNRALSQHVDTVLLANEINKCGSIDPLMHYHFLMHTVAAKKRYGKWAKSVKEDEDTIKLISHKFNTSFNKAKQYFKLLSEDDIKQIKNEYNTGGVK